jgi:hypothetical protein
MLGVMNAFDTVTECTSDSIKRTAWEMIRENLKISTKESLDYYELKKHELWFSEGCSELLDQRRQAKLLK